MKSFNFVLLRSPLQSIQEVFNTPADLTKVFSEGLYLASSAFWKEFQRNDNLNDKEKRKLGQSFFKYWLRSCTRCTPYGTFAGSAVINLLNEDTRITLRESNCHTRRIRLDMNYVSMIRIEIEKLPHVREQLKLMVNNSLYETAFDFRYAEYSTMEEVRKYRLTSIEKSDYLQFVLKYAKEEITIDGLALPLSRFANVTHEEARAFIMELWSSQILISDLETCITGKEPIYQLIEQLEKVEGVDKQLNCLKEVMGLLERPEEGIGFYKKIENLLQNTFVLEDNPKNIFQTDLVLSLVNNEIDKNVIDSIVKELEELMVLSVSMKNPELENFKKSFSNKFEEREIPLAIALDADLGIGYAGVFDESVGASEWIDGIPTVLNNQQTNNISNNIQGFTFSKYHDYLKNKKSFIEIKEAELRSFDNNLKNSRFANSMYVCGSLLKKDGLLDDKHHIFSLVSFSGPSGGNLFGRFTHGDETLYNLTKNILRTEEQEYPESIYAEITHLPQTRAGNVLLRKVLRKYEIPYVGKSGAELENQILIEDLMISIKKNEIVLRSKKHNKRVIPRLTSAHNFYQKSLPVYKFLCDLQFQGISSPIIWDWGQLNSVKQLPRVVYKSIIIKKAQWKIDEKDISDLSTSEPVKFFEIFRHKWNIPEQVVIVEGDNQLLIDFRNEKCLELVLEFIKKFKTIIIEEFLFNTDNCVVRDVNNAVYTNEIIIPLDLENKEVKTPSIKLKSDKIVKRKFAPLSEWLYFKIYTGSKTTEFILNKLILPFIESGINLLLFEKFFFVRYRDDLPHLRIRFFNSDVNKQTQLQIEFMKLLQPLIDSELVEKILIDTYIRENERYGLDLMEESESIFHNDSLAVLKFINLLDDQYSKKYKILFSLRSIDILLDDFGFSLDEKTKLLKLISTSYFNEFGGQSDLRKRLNDKYRKNQADVFSYMDNSQDINNEIEDGISVFAVRSKMNAPIIKVIISKIQDRDKEQALFELLSSYMHMFMNRLFISQQRRYELVVYFFLEKYYMSKCAMQVERY